MLKIFRRIRRKLLNEGSLRKYSVYAIGEILLVMIGILLALQVNDWNQHRLERIEEQNALQNLKTDFESNQQLLQNSINRLKIMIASTLRILENTGEKHSRSSNLNLDSLLIVASSTPRYFPQNGSLNDLISSGKLSLIQNGNLRNQLSSWNTHIDFIADRMDINHTHSIKITDYVSKHGNWLRADAINGLEHTQLPESGF